MAVDTTSLFSHLYEDIAVQSHMGLYAADTMAADITNVVKRIRWTDSLTEAARRVEITVDNFQADDLSRVHVGSNLALYGHVWEQSTNQASPDRRRLFTGLCYLDLREDNANDAQRTYVCYDYATFLARHEDVLVYDNTTLSGIFNDICSRFSLRKGTVAETGPTPTIGRLVMGSGMTLWGLLQEAIRRTYRLTGKRYFVRTQIHADNLSYLYLHELGQTSTVWKFHDGPGGNVLFLGFEESAEETRTRVTLVTEEVVEGSETTRTRIIGSQTAGSTDPLRQTFGVVGRVIEPDETSQSEAQHNTQLAQEFANSNRTVKRASLTILPPPQLRKGDRVIITSDRGGVSAAEWIVETVQAEWSPGDVQFHVDLVFSTADVE